MTITGLPGAAPGIGERFEEGAEALGAVGIGHLGRSREAADGPVVDPVTTVEGGQVVSGQGRRVFSRCGLLRFHYRMLGWANSLRPHFLLMQIGRVLPGANSQRYSYLRLGFQNTNRENRTPTRVRLGMVIIIVVICLAVTPSLSWSKEKRSYGRTEMPLTSASAHDLVRIDPGLTDDSEKYRIYMQNTLSKESAQFVVMRVPVEYLRRENVHEWYNASVLSGRDHFTQVTSGDCSVKTLYFFSAEYTGRSADIVIARSAYPDPAGMLGPPPRTVLDRLGIRKSKRGKWEIKFLSEKTLDKYYCFESEIYAEVFRYEERKIGHCAAGRSPASEKGTR